MSYQILPNIIFILAILGIILLIVRRLPEAAKFQEQTPSDLGADKRLLAKGLPAEAFSKIATFLKYWVKKVWNFILEAKDLKPHAIAGYKMKKMFSNGFAGLRPAATITPAVTAHDVKSEQYYLDMIKLQPKNLYNYDVLGRFYLEQENIEDAKDIYQYLANHQPGNPEYHARLAYCFYIAKQFGGAAEHYQKSLALDSTQPNRYYNLGLSLEAAGDLPQAIKNFETAVTLEPAVKYYISLSNAYLKATNSPKARETLLKAQTLDPQNQTVKVKLEKLQAPKVLNGVK